MEYVEHIAAIDAAMAAFGAALGAGPLDVSVPSCPAWTFHDLAEHVWNHIGFWTHVVCDATGRPKPPWGSMTPDRFGALADALRSEAPDTTAWSWVPGHADLAFVARRSAHELTVHRFDAQLARHAPEAIDPTLAADCIDEIFVLIGALGGRGNGETLHLHGTEGDEWMIAMTPGGVEVERAHAKGDLALRGAVSDLALTLYGRPPVGTIERFGDDAVMDAWRAAFAFG